MRGAALILALALAGCRTIPGPPQVVEVVVEKIVGVPAGLTAACDEVAKQADTYGEAIRLANTRLESLKACNKRMAEIRALGQ